MPLIIRGPRIPRGRRVQQLAANIDLARTIVDATGVVPGRVMDGRSLLPFARDPSLPLDRGVLIVRGPEGNAAARFAAVRTDRYIYAEFENGDRELYDLQEDPDQLTSVHADPAYAAVEESLAAQLSRLRTCSGAGALEEGGCG